MNDDVIFLFVLFVYLFAGAGILIIVDFTWFAFTGVSPLCVAEKFIFDKLGK